MSGVQLPPNSNGAIVDTRTTSAGKERQLVGVVEPPRPAPTRASGGQVIFSTNFRSIHTGFWNDGVGTSDTDFDILDLAGNPTMRLDNGGNVNGAPANPNRTAITTGVVTKRRVHDGYAHKFGMEFWFRYTSLNLTSNALLSASIYNRNGAQAHHARVWLDPAGNNVPMVARILDGVATIAANPGQTTNGSAPAVYTAAVTSLQQNGAGTHTYDPPTGRLDRAGGWHSCKLVVDFANLKYVSIQLDGQPATDLSPYLLDITDTTGFAGLHLSFEFSASTSTRRFVHIGNPIVTLED